MRGPRYEQILASTALALILSIPLGVSARDVERAAAVPQPPATPAPGATSEAPPAPAAATDHATTPDPLASLDPADRVIAEYIRDLLAMRGDKIFSS